MFSAEVFQEGARPVWYWWRRPQRAPEPIAMAMGIHVAVRRLSAEDDKTMPTVNVRYMVDDVEAAVAFYTSHLGFMLISKAPPAFADVALGDLRLLLSGPTSSAGR